MVAALGEYRAHIGSQELELPIIRVSEDVAIALLITVDQGVSFIRTAGQELAAQLESQSVEVVASVATMGIPVAIEVSRALGLDDYVILQKTAKIHLEDAYMEPVTSITTGTPQRLLLDRNRVSALSGRRVALVDDIISTGESVNAALKLLRRARAMPVAIGVLATEGGQWRELIGSDVGLVRSLGSLPLFRHSGGRDIEAIDTKTNNA